MPLKASQSAIFKIRYSVTSKVKGFSLLLGVVTAIEVLFLDFDMVLSLTQP